MSTREALHIVSLDVHEAMEKLIYIVLDEYPETDERYKVALAVATEFGIDIEKGEWVGLTDEEFHDLQIEHIDDPWSNFKAIEAKLKEENT